jgi:hypothetical protein
VDSDTSVSNSPAEAKVLGLVMFDEWLLPATSDLGANGLDGMRCRWSTPAPRQELAEAWKRGFTA